MKILDSNKDFYDFYQNIYRDDTYTFDRRDSFNLSRKDFASHFYYEQSRYKWFLDRGKNQCVLLQVCNNFWLFKVTIDKTDSMGKCIDYSISLIAQWKDYSVQTKLIELSHIRFILYSEEEISKNYELLIRTKDYEVKYVWNKSIVSRSHGIGWDHIEKHIPILKDIGIAGLVDPLDIYLALEEYFARKVTESERVESIGLTDNEKIENHGFDTKISFRGKY